MISELEKSKKNSKKTIRVIFLAKKNTEDKHRHQNKHLSW